ncbi:DUF4350 domain-containing protein [Fulvivirga lutea]|uniref:DUF4350 domain-containing protein n=1 Tax=Fulvivirga lutea TaxID=2810512 RepID=A0A974WGW9_9BACT|nr:DUF4350 domain-containing protein [Fulvivirga lutea]QSE98308.1 DUF4350 domain-containing protein [Fulvivirga lutea]
MWSKYKYYIVSGIALVLIGVLESIKPKEVVWLESYSRYDKIPYGNFVLFNELESIFSESIVSSSESLSQTLDDAQQKTNLIIINNSFQPAEVELEALLEFVNNGNQVLIASRTISQALLDTLNLSIENSFDDEIQTSYIFYLKDDSTRYTAPNQSMFFRSYFANSDEGNYLGFNSDDQPNFAFSTFGKGKIYLHLTPNVFSNVFMLADENHHYISQVLSYLPDQHTIWDEYYKVRKNYISKTPFQHILTTEGLQQALYLLLLGTLLYIIFASKRKQRIIPVLPTKANTTVEFVETIGQLYYNESDHKDIGMKRIDYFLAEVREKYRLDTEVLDDTFAKHLSNSSGVPFEDVSLLVTNFKVIRAVANVLDERIIEQEKLIENFYKKARSYGK